MTKDVDAVGCAIDFAMINPQEFGFDGFDAFASSAHADTRRPKNGDRCVIHEHIGAFDFRLDRRAVAEDCTLTKDHQLSGANRNGGNGRVVVANHEGVRSSVRYVDYSCIRCRHQGYPKPDDEKGYGMSRAPLKDILQ